MGVENRICEIVFVIEIQFGFISEKGTIDEVTILRRLH